MRESTTMMEEESTSRPPVPNAAAASLRLRSQSELASELRRLDGKPYGAYHDLIGGYTYDHGGLTLFVDKVQSDPYAAPSRVRCRIGLEHAHFPADLHRNRIRTIALCDAVARKVVAALSHYAADRRLHGDSWSSGKGGDLRIEQPSQHVLERSSVVLDESSPGYLEVRFRLGLPARGRSILGDFAADILLRTLPRVLQMALDHRNYDAARLREHVLSVEDQEWLRSQLSSRNLVGFVRDGAILPRKSGASDEPMAVGDAEPFRAPESMRQRFELPSGRVVEGMGVPKGITLIVGGGYHGKSTLLQALSVGVYNHIPGDGREFVCCDASAVTIRAEDGRSVCGVDISPFIGTLPNGKDTRMFSTANASGSTSQAANIVEALELGSTCFLVDEDQCATNFMIRDQRMQRLVSKAHEPITPLIYKIRQLRDEFGVSVLLVMGGSGDYLDVADAVLMMREYVPVDVTKEAAAVRAELPSALCMEGGSSFGSQRPRILAANNFGGLDRAKVRSRTEISLRDDDDVVFPALSQIVEVGQTLAVLDTLKLLHHRKLLSPSLTLHQLLLNVVDQLDQTPPGLALDRIRDEAWIQGGYARPRLYEIAAIISRIRNLSLLSSK